MEHLEYDDEFLHWQEPMDESVIEVTEEALRGPIANLPENAPITVAAGSSVGSAVDLLVENSIGAVLVVDGEKLEGIFSERDLLSIMADRGVDWGDLVIDDVMTRKPATLHIDDRLIDALSLMHRGGYRHVPIVDSDGRPVSMVSVRDIVAFIVDFFPQEVLNLPPHPVRSGARAREGA